ncbi:unnamed protein product [Amoebophrya sp. A120]|nr:unnamed protein product [Amoebophrya sp. A120]|eukprot:GSA120T00003027001.1
MTRKRPSVVGSSAFLANKSKRCRWYPLAAARPARPTRTWCGRSQPCTDISKGAWKSSGECLPAAETNRRPPRRKCGLIRVQRNPVCATLRGTSSGYLRCGRAIVGRRRR